MQLYLFATVCLLARAAWALPKNTTVEDYAWPQDVLLGGGLSAIQAEGAWNVDGKSEGAFERLIHRLTERFKYNADRSAEHYYRFREDLALAKELKFTGHRFSISWARIFPTGDVKAPNPLGIKFYRDYIAEVKKNGMEPVVTMYHFGHPAVLEDKTGGWGIGDGSMVDRFVEYADFLFATYGEEVKYWTTLNEVNMFCNYFPVMNGKPSFGPCVYEQVLAHTRTYRLYKQKYHAKQKGYVGLSVLFEPGYPASTRYVDVMAADAWNQLFMGTVLHPLVYGDFPATPRRLLPDLPHFSDSDKQLLIGACDFVGANVYNGHLVEYRTTDDPNDAPDYLNSILSNIPSIRFLKTSSLDTLDREVMEAAVLWQWNNYRMPVMISENGYADYSGQGLMDIGRAEWHSVNLRSLVRTARTHNIPLVGYFVWSLMDVYEFRAGYTTRPFGLIHVDYESGSLNRTLKQYSSKFFIELARTGRVPDVEQLQPSAAGALATSVALSIAASVLHAWRCS